MSRIFNVWSSLLDLLSPRSCAICGRRLSISEQVFCSTCNIHLPRTDYYLSAFDNPLARVFWGVTPIERCAAYFFYYHHTASANLIYALKYSHQPEIGETLGRIIAREYAKVGFFDGIDALVPMPITAQRRRERGYNQCEAIVQGIHSATGLPILADVVERAEFAKSQTKLGRLARARNVEGAFRLKNPAAIAGKHLLIVDDIITTGATIKSLSAELLQAENIKISIFALGCAGE